MKIDTKIITTISLVLLVVELFAQNTVTVIECDDVRKAKFLLDEVSYKAAIEIVLNDKIEGYSNEKRNMALVSSRLNPFVFAVHTAYAEHRPLSLSPDMIWLLICQGFTKHVDYHSEELRDRFVQFPDKKKIKINTEWFSLDFHKGSQNNPWHLVFPAFADSINKYVGNNFSTLIVSEFSTTTLADKIAFEVTLMDAVSSYFDYEILTSCGIPQIYIEGSLSDWERIKENTQKLKGYNIDNWITALEPIIDEFINAKKGKINHEFWQSIYKSEGGSGGPYIKGWLIKLFPYIVDFNHKPMVNDYIDKEPTDHFSGLKTYNFCSGVSKADFVWNYLGSEFDMEFVAGFIGIKQDKTTLTLRPEIGWAVKDKKKDITNEKSEDN